MDDRSHSEVFQSHLLRWLAISALFVALAGVIALGGSIGLWSSSHVATTDCLWIALGLVILGFLSSFIAVFFAHHPGPYQAIGGQERSWMTDEESFINRMKNIDKG